MNGHNTQPSHPYILASSRRAPRGRRRWLLGLTLPLAAASALTLLPAVPAHADDGDSFMGGSASCP